MKEKVFAPEMGPLDVKRWESLKEEKQSRILPSGPAETVFAFGDGTVGCDAHGSLFWGGEPATRGSVAGAMWGSSADLGRVIALDVAGPVVAVLQRDNDTGLWLTVFAVHDDVDVVLSVAGDSTKEARRYSAGRHSAPVAAAVNDVFVVSPDDVSGVDGVELVLVGGGVAAVVGVTEFTGFSSRLAERYATAGHRPPSLPSRWSPSWEGVITFGGLG